MSKRSREKKESSKNKNHSANKKKPLGSFKKILVEELNENEIFEIMVHAQYTGGTETCCAARYTEPATMIC